MASRDFLKHVVSTSEPVGSTLGDQWYNPTTNTLSQRLAVNGTSVQWVQTFPTTTQATGLQNFTESISIIAPNDTIPVSVLTAKSSNTNTDVAIIIKGTGAILAQVPDNTTLGGNKRGTNAVDFQMSRNSASQVASGNNSVVASGQNNTAQGPQSVVVGGRNNSATGPYSSVLGGDSNAASGYWSTALGYLTEANSSSSLATGYFSSTRSVQGYHAFGASNSVNNFSLRGSIQSGLLLVGAQTTDATITTLVSDPNSASATNQIALPSNSAYYVKGSVIATVTNGGATKAWTFECVIKRALTAVTTSIVGTAIINVTAADAGASTWTIALSADTTAGALAIRVTGQVANTIRWVCKAETTEVTF
jgi:hypothetical protein